MVMIRDKATVHIVSEKLTFLIDIPFMSFILNKSPQEDKRPDRDEYRMGYVS